MNKIAVRWPAKVAETLADAIGANLFEIEPEVPYTQADLNWMDKKSRSTIEMNDKAFRPAIVDTDAGIQEYDEIFIGFLSECVLVAKKKRT